jgi:hypothetical protein
MLTGHKIVMDSTHMVKKKLIGMIVSSILVIGNYAVATASQGEGGESIADDAGVQNWVEAAVQKAFKEFVEKGELVKIFQQAMTQVSSQPKESAVEPFTSAKSVKEYISRIKDNEVDIKQDLPPRLEATANHFSRLERTPIRVPSGDWKKAKIIEVLHEIKKNFPRTSLASRCDAIVHRHCTEDPGEYMRLLLMSQCVRWNDAEGDYKLSINAQESTVEEALRDLEGVIFDVGDGDESGNVGSIKVLLGKLKRIEEFKKFFI